MCKQSVRHVSTTKYLWSIVSIGRHCLVKSFLSVHGPGTKPSYKDKKNVHGPGQWQGVHGPGHENGPWIRSKEGVHGPLVHVLSSPTWTSSKKNLPAADDCLLPPLKINEKKHELVSRWHDSVTVFYKSRGTGDCLSCTNLSVTERHAGWLQRGLDLNLQVNLVVRTTTESISSTLFSCYGNFM